ncbi:MAG: Uma2 family endonuclease [Gomphosphaeria aponina SAG 52.96 = DSM 107014]|uniref:Uma2 family endonuclease n=1 Tax=Gomphosphaeria aponina SAG 52.96 = DSM 107014 TaxID=1521640 RepID=A0A941GSV3_9CHRO|nr:Uma2 family endonuclease [Gomphosphaeria aponina SAG 52.96 = DSM 107014]
MQWQEVCENKQLQDLPFKIELNKWGQIVMSPARLKHSLFQGLIIDVLNNLVNAGVAFPECAILTKDNIKVADVVWVSDARLDIIEDEDAASIAPEICIEIKSASNTIKEMEEKKDLYLAAKAEEVWLCDQTGKIRFYNQQGELEKSLLVPNFPPQIRHRKDSRLA